MGEVRQSRTATARSLLVLALVLAMAPAPAGAGVTAPGTQIVNVATAAADAPRGGEAALLIQSNRVITVVAPLLDADLRLEVLPGTTVAPGTELVQRLRFESLSTAVLTSGVVRLPLDPLLPAPTSFTGGPGGPVEPLVRSAAYDPGTHQVSWSLADLAPGAVGTVELRVLVPPSTPEDVVLPSQGFLGSAEISPEVPSNAVDVHVLAPILTLSKAARRETALVGETVGYSLRLGNTSSTAVLQEITVRDRLPRGFTYVPGSARLDGAPIPDPPVDGEGRLLTFDLPPPASGGERMLEYLARVGPGAERGDGTNIAVASARSAGGGQLTAGPARAAVRVSAGLFSGESVIIGRVFVDADGDRSPGPGEPGVPGVRLFLDDGTFVITDVMGKFHVEGVRRGLRVLRLDGTTLPPGLAASAAGPRSGGEGDSLFLDLLPDELYKANFPVRRPDGEPPPRFLVRLDDSPRPVLQLLPGVFGDETRRSRTYRQRAEEVAQYLRDLGLTPRTVRVEPEDGAPAALAAALEEVLQELVVGGAAAAAPARPPEDPEARVREMPPTLAILSPADGATVQSASGEVEVRVPLPARPVLTVNGRRVPASQVAREMIWEAGGIGVYLYLSVPYREGSNRIALATGSEDGAAGEELAITVFRAGRPSAVVVRSEPTPADGTTEASVRLEVLDSNGHPVPDGTIVNVTTEDGRIAGVDADPAREGFQARTRNGIAEVRLPPASNAEERHVRAESGLAGGEGVASYVAAASDWFVVGVAEGRVGSDAVGGLAEIDGEEVGLEEDPLADGRVSVFARGSVARDHVLTVAYDSDRRSDPDKLFREIDPERFFPAYGDSSLQGYAAETSGKMFARWEHAGSWALIGDFNTGLTGQELTRYDRRLHGVAVDYNRKGFGVRAFGADTPHTLIRDEIPGAGISGPYALSTRPVVVNSEVISIEVRDRYHTERVLERRLMVRYRDYEIDTVQGTVLFQAPVAAADGDFNPVQIVVLYESDDDGEEHPVYGGRARYLLPGQVEVGGTYVVEEHQAGDYRLAGMDLEWRPHPAMRIAAELARSEEPFGLSGDAWKLEAEGNLGGRVRLLGYYRDLDPRFRNRSRSGALQIGTRKYGVEARGDLEGGLRFRGEAFVQQDLITGFTTRVAGGGVAREIGRWLLSGGYRYTAQRGGMAPSVSASVLSAGARYRFTRKLTGLLERDQVLGPANVENYPTRTRLGIDYLLPDGSKAFLHQEFDQGDGSTARRTLAGVESRLSERTVVIGQYTLEDSITGVTNQANLGVRTTVPLNRLWTAHFFGERVATLQGDPSRDFTAIGTSFQFLPDGLKFSSRLEARFGEADDRYLLTAAGSLKLGPRYTLFLRERLVHARFDGGGSDTDQDLLAGMAFRPVATDRFNWLARVNFVEEGGVSTVGAPAGRRTSGAFQLNVTPAPRWGLTAKLAGQHTREEVPGGAVGTLTALAQLRVSRDIGERWTVSGALRCLHQVESERSESGAGIEVGYLLIHDLWLAAGYNFTGFDDRRFAEAEGSEQGPYIAVRFKFDENTFRGWH